MADVLSQSEVESLLAALDPRLQGAVPSKQARRSDDMHSQISVYDFKRPERVSKEQMRAFQALHDGFSREFGAGLSGMLRSIVEVKLISVDQLTYSEFVFSLENPTCFNLLESEGLDGHIILDLNPSIIFPIVDRLLGGGRDAHYNPPGRALTEIELRLVSRITGLAIRSLENAWANLVNLNLRVVQIESNPQLVQIVPPNEVIVLISFEIALGEMRGIMNLCIPFNTIEPLAGKLSSDSWSAYKKRSIDERQRLNLEAGLTQARVEMVVRLAQTVLTARDLTNLAIGDVITTEQDSKMGMQILVEGRPMFTGTPGLIKGRKAVQISSAIAGLKDLVESQLRSRENPQPGAAIPSQAAPQL